MFYKNVKKIAVIIDDIDGINNTNDKGGLTAIINIIRPKTTKKQRANEMTILPIICIGNYQNNKKTKELIKVCNVIKLNPPTDSQIISIINNIMPNFKEKQSTELINYIQNDLQKLKFIIDIYTTNPTLFDDNIKYIFDLKTSNDDAYLITSKLLNTNYDIDEHSTLINENDRTTVGLLWHENIIDIIDKLPLSQSFILYKSILDDMCFADYIFRITFQKQIWQLNEMSSLIKTFKTNNIFHNNLSNIKKPKYNSSQIRFTKILTKYSTEYNNSEFIQQLCYKLGMEKLDLFSYFLFIKNIYTFDEIVQIIESYNVTNFNEEDYIKKLDINRLYLYIDHYLNNMECENVQTENIIEVE